MEYYSKGTLGTSGGPTLRLYENGSMGDIYINQRLRQSPNGYIWKDPLMEVWLLKIRNTARLALFFLNIIWDGMVSVAWKGWNSWICIHPGGFGGLVVSDTQA